ncbi:MAG: hypothetical protein LQ340_006941, partial [Diploschistes diacapsis]
DTFRWRIGQSEKASALEQLRYTIIGSQLLSDRAPNGLSRRLIIAKRQSTTRNEGQSGDPQYTTRGLLITGCSAFACALSIWWATKPSNGRLSKTRISFICAILLAASLLVYGLFVRQFRRHARSRAIEAASQLVSNALVFDSNAHAAITLIQEVELVSRGYRLSSPLPPASRLEDGKDQARRCARLRRTLRLALDSITSPHVEAYHSLRPFVNEVDLDRYFDMYELSRTDIGEVEESLADRSEADDLESIRILKVDLHRLFTARKMFLSAILALDADTKPNKLDWTLMTDIMESISGITAVATSSLEGVIGEEERFSIPPSPRTPLTPGRERLQHQVRKFTTLSQGLRGLQAKMHILREDSDKALGSSDDVMALGSSLLEQYDAFGSDLRALVADWEEGRSALTASIGKHERRMSLNSTGMIFSRSPTPSSLGGITEVGGSPPEAFKILAGDPMSRLDAASSDEEIFEAMASPRPRSTLTRDERLAKMKEDRAKLASARERIDASRFMVKELETVIKARPRGRTSGRVTSI